MKRFLVFIFLVIPFLMIAQNSVNRANKLFDRMWYKEAAQLYEAAIGDDYTNKDLLQRAGDSYYYNTDMKNALRWYEILISNHENDVEPEYLFRYAHSLQGTGNNKAAKRWMKKFAKVSEQEDTRKLNYAQNEITLEDILNLEPEFQLKNVHVNTKYSDFGPAYYKHQLVYSSAVDSSTFHTRIYEWNKQPFLNFYLGELNLSESDVKRVNDFSDDLNTRYHEATLAFTSDYKTVYFTRNNYDGKLGKDNNGINHLKLYSASAKINDEGVLEWEDITELPFNSEDYSVGHPALSSDDSKLYFVSDMPGSIGATDIFVVDIMLNTDPLVYSKPRNLGPAINTAGREMFPYITDKSLYFASDGHLGLGGLDIFQSSVIEGAFTIPFNLGAPLNSSLDDFGLIIKEEEYKGFVCSNRMGGKGDDDIYSFVRDKEVISRRIEASICEQTVNGFVSNEVTGERLADVYVELVDENGQQLAKTISDLNGHYSFEMILDCSQPYEVRASKIGYSPKNKEFTTENKTGEIIVSLEMKTLNELIVEEDGLLKIKIGIVYFDLDKSNIRANDAAIELNKIVLLMTEYPKMVIKIESHTDSRAPDTYNLELSDRRAKSTRDYLINKGIERERIESAKGYGETQLLNNCSNGVPCSESKHQFNRRSEFIIIKM